MTEKHKFIEILDEYQKKKDFQCHDLNNVLQLSQLHYFSNQYYIKSYVGMHQNAINPFASSLDTPRNQQKPIKSEKISMTEQMEKMENHIFAVVFDDLLEPPPSSPKKTRKETISVEIKCFSDLLTIVQNHPYDETAEYNINLKALHQIKTELETLDKMIGMVEFKNSIVDQILYFVQNLHLGKNADFMHTVLSGPPGTGKTEVAKILGQMYSKIGILKNNVFKKVTRGDLIAGYLGQTAIKTNKVIQECLGGCLFIDEAYSLAAAGDHDDIYSKECLDTLCEALSDHKGDLMVIIAGYENALNETFFRVNRGLDSRFIWRFKIDNYTAKELTQIFRKMVQENEWTFDLNLGDSALSEWFEKKKESFAFFGRDVELLFSYTKVGHGRRIYGKSDELRKCLNMDDLNAGYAKFLANSKKKNERTEIFGLYV